jgi:hypothetical protein
VPHITKLQLCKTHKRVNWKGGAHIGPTLADGEIKYNKIAI